MYSVDRAHRADRRQESPVPRNGRRSPAAARQHSVRRHVVGQPRPASDRRPRSESRPRRRRRLRAGVPVPAETRQTVQRDLLRRQSDR